MPHISSNKQYVRWMFPYRSYLHDLVTVDTRGRAPACQTWPSGQVSVAASAIIADSHGLLEQDIGHQALVLQKLTGDG